MSGARPGILMGHKYGLVFTGLTDDLDHHSRNSTPQDDDVTRSLTRRLAILPMVVGSVQKSDFRGAVFGSGYMLRSLIETRLYDEVHFFAPLLAHQGAYERMVADVPWLRSVRVSVHQMLHLHKEVVTHDYDLVFAPTFSAEVAGLASLRKATGTDFRILSVIYSISYPDTETAMLLNMHAPLRDDDLLNCTSESGFTIMLALAGHLRKRFGVPLPLTLDMAVVPYGIDTEEFCPGERDQACAFLGLDAGTRYILSLGRFSVVDKFDIGPVIEAFVRARQRLGGSWKLILAGAAAHGTYLEWVKLLLMRRGIDDAVIIRPDVSDAEKVALYRASEIFVAPSDNPQETFGLTAIEAMSCNVPVVAADWDGYKESVVHGETGLRVPTYMPRFTSILPDRKLIDNSLMHLLVAQTVAVDVARLAEAIILLGSDEPYRLRLAEGARQRATNVYDVRQVGAALRHVLTIREIMAAEGNDTTGDAGETLDNLVPDTSDASSLWDLFGDFATRSLVGADTLVTSEYGTAGLAETLPVYLTPEMEELLYLDLVRPICRACVTASPLEGVRAALLMSGRDPDRVDYTIYWAVKQGLLDVNPT